MDSFILDDGLECSVGDKIYVAKKSIFKKSCKFMKGTIIDIIFLEAEDEMSFSFNRYKIKVQLDCGKILLFEDSHSTIFSGYKFISPNNIKELNIYLKDEKNNILF